MHESVLSRFMFITPDAQSRFCTLPYPETIYCSYKTHRRIRCIGRIGCNLRTFCTNQPNDFFVQHTYNSPNSACKIYHNLLFIWNATKCQSYQYSLYLKKTHIYEKAIIRLSFLNDSYILVEVSVYYWNVKRDFYKDVNTILTFLVRGPVGTMYHAPLETFFIGANLFVGVYWVVFNNDPMKKLIWAMFIFTVSVAYPLFPYNDKGYMHKFYHILVSSYHIRTKLVPKCS